jgi:hypothetical protein
MVVFRRVQFPGRESDVLVFVKGTRIEHGR